MPKKIQDCTKAHLISIDLPVHGDSYTVISHESVMDMSATALANAGFTIADEEYRATADGNIAQGIYRLTYKNDPELSMMFAWTNSYNKQVRFKCGVGAYINQTGTVMVCGDMGSWARKHTGTADEETLKTITDQITNAQMYYNQLVSDKNTMKVISMNKRKQAQMLGILFAEYQILTTEQASIIRQQMDKPSHVFEDTSSLWAFYNYVTLALQVSHPKTWMEDQRVLHYFVSTVIGTQAPVTPAPVVAVPEIVSEVDPNQLNLLDQIAEIESEEDPLMSVEVVVFDLGDPDSKPEPIQDYIERTAVEDVDHTILNDSNLDEVMKQSMTDQLIFGVSGVRITEDTIENMPIDEVIHYTDAAGNTFEAPVVPPCAGHDTETEKDLEEEILATEVKTFFEEVTPVVSLEPTPEDYIAMEAEEANLDLVPAVEQPKVIEEEADFDLDFTSESDEEEEDIAFEF